MTITEDCKYKQRLLSENKHSKISIFCSICYTLLTDNSLFRANIYMFVKKNIQVWKSTFLCLRITYTHLNILNRILDVFSAI